MIMAPLNMRCPCCGKYGYVRSLTGLSELYIAKCTNCNFYISTDDIAQGGSVLAEPNDDRCDITDERDRKIAELTEKLEAYERTGLKPEEIDPLARTLSKLRTMLGCKDLQELEKLLERATIPPNMRMYELLATTSEVDIDELKRVMATCEAGLLCE